MLKISPPNRYVGFSERSRKFRASAHENDLFLDFLLLRINICVELEAFITILRSIRTTLRVVTLLETRLTRPYNKINASAQTLTTFSTSSRVCGVGAPSLTGVVLIFLVN